jgi:hypothetical protein
MTPEDVAALFTRANGEYAFARWGRPIAPVIFGVDDATLAVFKGAIEAVARLAGHAIMDTDPELGANVMVFFTRTWDELLDVPKLVGLVPDLGGLVARLNAAGANQYRYFRFDEGGAIKLAFVFLRLDDHLAAMAAEDVALAQAAQIILAWGDRAFATCALLGELGGVAVLHPDIAAVIRAAYAPHMPAVATESAHALRLFARL